MTNMELTPYEIRQLLVLLANLKRDAEWAVHEGMMEIAAWQQRGDQANAWIARLGGCMNAACDDDPAWVKLGDDPPIWIRRG